MPVSVVRAAPGHGGDSPNLDVLRSAAVSFVVIFHVALFFGGNRADALLWPLGHWGVLVFFVHTSLVLMFSLERQLERRPDERFFWRFMLRRVFRIAPLATLFILAIAGLKLPVGHLREGHFLAVSLAPVPVLENLFFIQNITHAESVEAPLWSLPYEMQMYLVLPFLFVFVRRLSTTANVFACWLAIAVICYVLTRPVMHGRFEAAEYVPCFLSGILAYRLIRLPHKNWPFAVWIAMLVVFTACYVMRPSLAVGWLCCLALGFAASKCAEITCPAIVKTSHLIARYSYGVYLSHFVCIWFVFVALRGLSLPARILLFAILLVAVPVALYHIVEAPMVALGSRLASAKRQRASPSSATS